MNSSTTTPVTAEQIEAGEAAWRSGDGPDTDMVPDVRAIYLAMLKAQEPAVVGEDCADCGGTGVYEPFDEDGSALEPEPCFACSGATHTVSGAEAAIAAKLDNHGFTVSEDEVVEREDAWLDMKNAPRDGTMIWLLMDYGAYGTCPLADAGRAATLGFCNHDQDTDWPADKWQYVAWSWEQDCFHDHETDNHKLTVPAAWRPIGFDLDQTPAEERV